MKKKLFKFVKGLVLSILLIATIIFTIYSFAWFSFTKRAEAYLNVIWQDKTFNVSGTSPRFTGYPLVPTTQFSGTIEHQSGLKITTPHLIYEGFFAPRQLQMIDAPQGLKISSPFLEKSLDFDIASLYIRLPKYMPTNHKKEDIQIWQKTDDSFIIEKLVLKSGSIDILGMGTLSLDDHLQIKADINARVIGMDLLLDEMAKEQGEKTVAIARSFLKMMTKADEKTGQRYFETTLKIQNRGIYFGPMRISGLPEIKWE